MKNFKEMVEELAYKALKEKEEKEKREFAEKVKKHEANLETFSNDIIAIAEQGDFHFNFDDKYLESIGLPQDVAFNFLRENGFRIQHSNVYPHRSSHTIYWGNKVDF